MRDHLFAIPVRPEHPRDWRPQLLAFSDDSHRRKRLLRFASWIEGGSGLTTAVRILEGRGEKILKLRTEAEAELRSDITDQGLQAFSKVVAVPDFHIGAQTLAQSFGIGPIRVNTVLLNGPEQLMEIKKPKGQRKYGRYLNEAIRLGCNVIVLNAEEEQWNAMEGLPSKDRRIDVWWWDDATSRLMLLLAYLMTRTGEWSEAKIRVLAPSRRKGAKRNLERLRQTLGSVRINTEPEIILKTTMDTVVKQSNGAALVLLPLRFRKNQPLGPHGVHLHTLFSRLPIVALVIAAEDINLEAEPEEGKHAEVAAALDVIADAEKQAKKAEKEAMQAAGMVAEKLRELEIAVESDASKEKRANIEAAVREAKALAKKALRESERARIKAQEASSSAEAMIGVPVRREPEEVPMAPSEKGDKDNGGNKGPAK